MVSDAPPSTGRRAAAVAVVAVLATAFMLAAVGGVAQQCPQQPAAAVVGASQPRQHDAAPCRSDGACPPCPACPSSSSAGAAIVAQPAAAAAGADGDNAAGGAGAPLPVPRGGGGGGVSETRHWGWITNPPTHGAAHLLGIRGHDAPYRRDGKCVATTERYDITGDGTGLLNLTRKTPATCMRHLEPLNPHVPLRGVSDTCAKHQRRWSDVKEFKEHMDFDEADRRTHKAVLLGSVCPPTEKQRKIFFDAGCRKYTSSPKWLRTKYPGGKFFDIHGLDVVEMHRHGFYKDHHAAFYHAAVWNESGFVTFVSKYDLEGAGFFHTHWMDRPVFPLRTKLVTVPTVPFGDFIKSRSTPDDFVVVKIDIEGAEWLVLEHLAKVGAFEYIDEVLIECHHGEWVPAWRTQHSLADCHRLLNTLRDSGVYAHEWY